MPSFERQEAVVYQVLPPLQGVSRKTNKAYTIYKCILHFPEDKYQPFVAVDVSDKVWPNIANAQGQRITVELALGGKGIAQDKNGQNTVYNNVRMIYAAPVQQQAPAQQYQQQAPPQQPQWPQPPAQTQRYQQPTQQPNWPQPPVAPSNTPPPPTPPPAGFESPFG